jgi:hypothetical protein
MSELSVAEATELGLREQIAELVNARARAEAEARRLRARGKAIDPALLEVAERYRSQAKRLEGEVEALRASLRQQELRTERLRADRAGA